MKILVTLIVFLAAAFALAASPITNIRCGAFGLSFYVMTGSLLFGIFLFLSHQYVSVWQAGRRALPYFAMAASVYLVRMATPRINPDLLCAQSTRPLEFIVGLLAIGALIGILVGQGVSRNLTRVKRGRP